MGLWNGKKKTWAQVISISSSISFSIRIYIYTCFVITVTIKLLAVYSRWVWWKHGGFGSWYHIILFELVCLWTYPFIRFCMRFIAVWCWCIPAHSSSVSWRWTVSPSTRRRAGWAVFTLSTLHCTLDCVVHPPHFILYTPYSTLYMLNSLLVTSRSTLDTLHTTLDTFCFRVYTLHFTLHIPYVTFDALHSTLCTLYCIVHTLYFTLCTPYSTVYTLHSAF